MPKARFKLNKQRKINRYPVYLVFRYNNEYLSWRTELYVEEKHWDSKRQRVKSTREMPNYPQMNQHLNDVTNFVEQQHLVYFNNHHMHPPKEFLRKVLNKRFSRIAKSKLNKSDDEKVTDIRVIKRTGNVIAFFEVLLKEWKGVKNSATIGNYGRAVRMLKDYGLHIEKDLTFDDIDWKFENEYKRFLIEQKNFKYNTISSLIKRLKTLMNEAVKRKLTNNIAFKDFKASFRDSLRGIALSAVEVEAIASYDFSLDERLDRARDWFVIACYTALSYESLAVLTKEHIKSNARRIPVISVIRGKTATTSKQQLKAVVPLHPTVKAILNKYKGEFPPIISNQKLGQYIKEVCKEVGKKQPSLLESIEIVEENAGKKTRESIPKYELCAVHVGRRSFCTNCYLVGVDSLKIIKSSAHASTQTLMTYIKADKLESIGQQENSYTFFKQF